MFNYVLHLEDDEKYSYFYYPLCDINYPGEIHIYKDGRRVLVRESDRDIEGIYGSYALTNIEVGSINGNLKFPEVKLNILDGEEMSLEEIIAIWDNLEEI